MSTKISWASDVWNPVIGCTKVSAGCAGCYAMRMAARLASNPLTPEYAGVAEFSAGRNPRWLSVKTLPERLGEPLRWKKPRRVFVCSMADLFHDDVPDEFIAAVFGVMAACPQHCFLVLTKRPARMLRFFKRYAEILRPLETPDAAGFFIAMAADLMQWSGVLAPDEVLRDPEEYSGITWPLPNVHLGVSVEDQATADERIPLLLQTPATLHWASAEPLLGPVQFWSVNDGSWYDREGATRYDSLTGTAWHGSDFSYGLGGGPRLGHVVVGAESGPGARPMRLDWVRSIRDQCADSGVPLFVKQLTGEHGKVVKDITEFPADLQIQEYL